MLTGPLPEIVRYRKFADEKTELEGHIPLSRFQRLLPLLQENVGEVFVSIRFRKGSRERPLVTGSAKTSLSVMCQACLEPVEISIQVTINSILVPTESELLDLNRRQDGLVVTGDDLDLSQLFEDELIVNMPMAPRHEDGKCVNPVPLPEVEPVTETHRPFEDLKSLKGLKDLKS